MVARPLLWHVILKIIYGENKINKDKCIYSSLRSLSNAGVLKTLTPTDLMRSESYLHLVMSHYGASRACSVLMTVPCVFE